MPRLIMFGAACALLSPAWAQTPAPDVTKLVKDIAQKAESARYYSFEGELELAGQRGEDPGRILSQAKVRLAAGPEGQSYLQVDAPDKGEYLLISNGQKSWAYVPKLKQYTAEEASAVAHKMEDSDDATEADADPDAENAASDDERDQAEVFARLVMPILARLYKTASSAGTVGQAEVKFEKKKQRWPVIRVMAKPDEQQGSAMTELTLDPVSLNIGRLLWANKTMAGGEKVKMRLTLTFTDFYMGDAPRDAIFTFVPPKNAKLVDVLPIPGQTGSFLLNHPAPDFELKSIAGERVHLADLRGTPVLLTFWASWCGPCRRKLPELAKLYDQYKGQGLSVIGVNDEGKGTALDFARKSGLSFPILDDSSGKAHRLYRVHSIPAVYLIDRDGKVVRFFRGGRDYVTLRSALKVVGL